MATLTIEGGTIEVPQPLIARMADRMQRLGSAARRAHYAKKARERIAKGSKQAADAAIVLAAGG